MDVSKIYLLFLVCFCFHMPCLAQNSIFGRVVNKENKPVEFAAVEQKSSSTPIRSIQAVLTDSMGNFSMENKLFPNSSVITISSLGYLDQEILIQDTLNTAIHLDTITLQSDSKVLNEVIVTSKPPLLEKKIDRLVFNVEESVVAMGANALETLAKTPGVKVTNDNVSIIGKSGVNIMIDNRLQYVSGDDLVNFLKTIQASDISKIEVITNPSAQYDAEGNSGLINIVLKKNKTKGFLGSLTSSYSQASYGTFSSGASLSYKTEKNTFSLGLNYGKGSTGPSESVQTFYPTQLWDMVDKRRDYEQRIRLQAGLERQFSTSSVFGVNYTGMESQPNSDEDLSFHIFNNEGRLDSLIKAPALMLWKKGLHSFNAYYEKTLDTTGRKLNFAGDYLMLSDDRTREFHAITLDNLNAPIADIRNKTIGLRSVHIGTLKTDWDLPVNFAKFSVGAKVSIIDTKSDNRFYDYVAPDYVPDVNKTDVFNYQEHTQVLYLNAGKALKRADLQAGLRAEYTQTTGHTLSYNQTIKNRHC